MKIFFFYTLLLFNYSIFAEALHTNQDIRLQKAMLAYGKGNIHLTNRLIKQNINEKFHLPTFLFLAKSYKKEKKHAKAIRVYYYTVKKLHGTKLLSAGNISALKDQFQKVSTPNKDGLRTYYQIAKTFVKMMKSETNKKNKYWYNDLAIKYFYICKHYKYNLEKSRYNLGALQLKKNDKDQAKLNFNESRNSDNFKDKWSSEAMLGTAINENLDKNNRNKFSEKADDAATILLRRALLQSTSNTALYRYAENYLEHMSKRQSAFDATIKIGRETNLSKRYGNSTPDISSSFYRYELAGFLSKGFLKYWKFYFIGNFNRTRFYWPSAVTYGSQTLDGSGTIQYDHIRRTLLKVRYRIKTNYVRNSSNTLTRFSRLREIYPSLSYSFNKSIVSFQALLSKEYPRYTPEMTTIGNGGGISYVPFITSKYLSPSFDFFYSAYTVNFSDTSYTKTKFTFSNHFEFSPNFSTFLDINYQIFSYYELSQTVHNNTTKITLNYKTPLKYLTILGEIEHAIINEEGTFISNQKYNGAGWTMSTGLTIAF